jgi:hypothetical protein
MLPGKKTRRSALNWNKTLVLTTFPLSNNLQLIMRRNSHIKSTIRNDRAAAEEALEAKRKIEAVHVSSRLPPQSAVPPSLTSSGAPPIVYRNNRKRRRPGC